MIVFDRKNKVGNNCVEGRNRVILRGGTRYICNSKDEIIHGLIPSVKCVAPLIRDMFLAKV